jgi:hypothetical protein
MGITRSGVGRSTPRRYIVEMMMGNVWPLRASMTFLTVASTQLPSIEQRSHHRRILPRDIAQFVAGRVENQDRICVVAIVRLALEDHPFADLQAFAGCSSLGGSPCAGHNEIASMERSRTLAGLERGSALGLSCRLQRFALRGSLLLPSLSGAFADFGWQHPFDGRSKGVEFVFGDLAVARDCVDDFV